MIALQSLIERAARLNPTGVATTYKGTNVTWADTEQRVAALASGLQHLGLSEGDRVGILSLNCATYYEALFAVPWAGFCVVPLNTRWAVPENNYAIGDSGTRAVLFDDAFFLRWRNCVRHSSVWSTASTLARVPARTGQSMPRRSSMINHPARHRHEVEMKWRVFFIRAVQPDSPRV